MSDNTKLKLILLFGIVFGSIAIGFITGSLLCSILFAVWSVIYYAYLSSLKQVCFQMTDNLKEVLIGGAEDVASIPIDERRLYSIAIRADIFEELVEYVNKIEDEKRLLIHKVQNNE